MSAGLLTAPILTGDQSLLPWFALYVKSRHEKHIALILAAKGYQCFLPTYWTRDNNNRRFELPHFPGYVFCRLDTAKTLGVVNIPGVFSIIGGGKKPEPISEDEIDGVRRVIAAGCSPRPWPYIAPGKTIRLTEGPLRGVDGVVVMSSDARWLVVSVHLLQRSVAVKLDRASLSSHAICARSN